MTSTDFASYTIDLCPHCRGIWCEPQDWQQVWKRHPDYKSLPDVLGEERAPDLVFAGQSQLACPACARNLTVLKAGQPAICEIDQCDHCGGIWFDHQEWEHLEALRAWPAALEKLEAPPTAWNWCLQLLLRLPTEFNLPPRRFPAMTVTLIALCGVVFLCQLAIGEEQWLFLTTRPSLIAAGMGYWSLFTSMFLHVGLIHLLGNMYYLYIVGDNVEDALGPWRFLLFYLICGILADLVFVWMDWGSPIPALGASGAIAGVMAAYLLLFRRARLTMMLIFWQVKVAAWIWLSSWLALNLLSALMVMRAGGATGGVGWWAHVGGFVAGLLLIWPLERRIVRSYPLLQVMRTQGGPVRWFQWA